jgi:hypothetical protein
MFLIFWNILEYFAYFGRFLDFLLSIEPTVYCCKTIRNRDL